MRFVRYRMWGLWSEKGTEQGRQAIACLGFIFLGFCAEVWWFEMVAMMMKLLLTSVIIFVRPGSAIQLSVGFFIFVLRCLGAVY